MVVIRQAVAVALFKKSAVLKIYWDRRATADAALLIIGLGGIRYLWEVLLAGRGFSVRTLLFLLIDFLMFWIVRAGVCLLVGKVFFKRDSAMATIMRLHGFAYLPLILTFTPTFLTPLAILWFLAVLVYVTAEAMDLNWWQSAVTISVGVVGLFLISPLLWGGNRLF